MELKTKSVSKIVQRYEQKQKTLREKFCTELRQLLKERTIRKKNNQKAIVTLEQENKVLRLEIGEINEQLEKNNG